MISIQIFPVICVIVGIILSIIILMYLASRPIFSRKKKPVTEQDKLEIANDMKKYKDVTDSFNYIEKSIKRILFLTNIVLWLWSKKEQIKTIFGVLIISIPVWFLFRHTKAIYAGDIQLFYLSSLAIGYLFMVGLATQKPKKILKSEVINKKKQELITFYASNAPKPPKEWEPINLTPKPHPPSIWMYVFGSGSNHKHKEFIRTQYNDESEEFYVHDSLEKEHYRILNPEEIPEGLVQEMEQWSKNFDKKQELIKLWEHEYAMQRIIQWRFYYAERMANHQLKDKASC